MDHIEMRPHGDRPGRPSSGRLAAMAMAALLTTLVAGPVAAADEEQPTPGTDYAVLVRGTLFTDDLEAVQAAHDAVAAAGEEAARAAGDFAHLAALSTPLLGGAEGAFMGLDRWTAPEAIESFYADPAIAEAFGSLFAAPPTIEVFERRGDWLSWGELPDPSAGAELWFAVVRGTLVETDPAAAQEMHDAIAAGGQAAAQEAGDIAHVVFTGLADPGEFLAIDVWESDAAIEATYGDPAFGAAFASLFSEAPTIQVFRSTDWYQW